MSVSLSACQESLGLVVVQLMLGRSRQFGDDARKSAIFRAQPLVLGLEFVQLLHPQNARTRTRTHAHDFCDGCGGAMCDVVVVGLWK